MTCWGLDACPLAAPSPARHFLFTSHDIQHLIQHVAGIAGRARGYHAQAAPHHAGGQVADVVRVAAVFVRGALESESLALRGGFRVDRVHVRPAPPTADLAVVPSAGGGALGLIYPGADGRLFISAEAFVAPLDSEVGVALLVAMFHATK